MWGKFDPWWLAAAAAVVLTTAITLHSRGFSNREIATYSAIGLAAMPVAAFGFWFANRLMPPSDSLTWWQWFSGRNFLSQMIGYAIVFGIGSVVLLLEGEYWWTLATGSMCVASIIWARWKRRRLARRAAER